MNVSQTTHKNILKRRRDMKGVGDIEATSYKNVKTLSQCVRGFHIPLRVG